MAKSEISVSGPIPGVYVWEAPDKALTIHLSLDVVDGLLQDVMRGFGAVPKRGAEVGGILLGRNTPGSPPRIEITNYELTPIEYRRGPSFLMSEYDAESFDLTLTRLTAGIEGGGAPVGFFRSNTRDSVGLGPEDLALMDRHFPAPGAVLLFIRPFATQVSTAGFYYRENGRFQEGPALGEFPFRRKYLGGGEPSAPTSRTQPSFDDAVRPAEASFPRELQAPTDTSQRMDLALRPPQEVLDPRDEFNIPDPNSNKTGWVWLPVSLLFLMLGVLLGFQGALNLRPHAAAFPGSPYHVSLTVAQDGDNLNVRWDRQSQAIRAATEGLLTIEDANYKKLVDLDATQLQTGSVVYRHNSGDVKFSLELSLREGNKVLETAEWKR